MTSVISKSKKSLCLLPVCLFSSFLHASKTEECLDYLRAPATIHFVSTQKQTLIDPKIHYNHPTESLKDSFKDYYPSFIKGFDDSIEDIFFNTPFEKRKDKWENFRKDHKLSEEDAKAVEAYYSLLIFDGHPDYVDPASKQEAFQTVKKLSLEDLLKDPQRKQRYDYYQQSLGKLSVPEMAEELKITQGKVYQELSFYNLFITEAFNGNYGEGETQASRFIRHHVGKENRGVAWERFKDGEKEDALLVHFLNLGLTHAEIAAKLNEVFETINPTDPDIRTEKSVSQKIISLGLAQSSPRSLPDLNIDPYGHVKVAGKLVAATATQFIFDHKEKGFDWCAKQLGIKKESLEDFIKREHIEGIFKQNAEKRRSRPQTQNTHHNSSTKNPLELNKDLKYKVLEKSLELALNKDGALATLGEIAANLGIKQTRINGTGDYGSEKRLKHAIFKSPNEYYAALKDFAEKKLNEAKASNNTSDVSKLEKIIKKINETLSQKVLRTELAKINPQQRQTLVIENSIELALNKDGALATLGEIAANLGIKQTRITGAGIYGSGKQSEHLAIFKSLIEYYAALKDFAEKKLQEAKSTNNTTDVVKLEKVLEALWKKIQLETTSPQEYQTLVIEKSLELALNKDGELTTLGEIAADLGINQLRINGIGIYGSGKQSEHLAIFKSLIEYYNALKDFAQKKLQEAKESGNTSDVSKLEKIIKKINETLSQKVLHTELAKLNPQQIQTLVLEKSIEIALDKDGKLATLGEIAADLGINQTRITGAGNHGKSEHLAIFKSSNEYYGALKDFVENKLQEAKASNNTAEIAKLEKVLEAIRKKNP